MHVFVTAKPVVWLNAMHTSIEQLIDRSLINRSIPRDWSELCDFSHSAIKTSKVSEHCLNTEHLSGTRGLLKQILQGLLYLQSILVTITVVQG